MVGNHESPTSPTAPGDVERVARAIGEERDRWNLIHGGNLPDLITRNDDDGEPVEVSRHPAGDGQMYFFDKVNEACASAAIAALQPASSGNEGEAMVDGDAARHLWALGHIKDTIPAYMGDAPKAKHYQALHAAIDAAMFAIQTSAQPIQSVEVTQEKVAYLAHILEEWDMKPTPDECTGHNYEEIARDALSRLASQKGG